MNLNRKITAFTIMELLVALVLTSILTALAFYGFQLFQKQIRLINQQRSTALDYHHFASLVKWEMTTARFVERDDDKLIFVKDSLEVTYQVKDSTITRYHKPFKSTPEVFEIQAEIISMRFQNQEINHGLIDHLKLEFTFFGEKQIMVLDKQYSSENLISYPSYANRY